MKIISQFPLKWFKNMTYVVTPACINCKYKDCVNVCPVDCFYEGKNMLAIKPDECIDCGVCEVECPAKAIVPDTEPEGQKWLELNQKYSQEWPRITEQGDPPADADDWLDVPDKYEKHFDPTPGKGDKS